MVEAHTQIPETRRQSGRDNLSRCKGGVRVRAPWFLLRSGAEGRDARGFTLIELMVVLSIMGILLTIAQPSLKQSIIKAREAVLKDDLFQMREAIDQYYADNGKYPDQLTDLVNPQDRSRSYLRSLPKDPFTNAPDWITVAPEEGTEGAVFDVHSASPFVAIDGSAYNTW